MPPSCPSGPGEQPVWETTTAGCGQQLRLLRNSRCTESAQRASVGTSYVSPSSGRWAVRVSPGSARFCCLLTRQVQGDRKGTH